MYPIVDYISTEKIHVFQMFFEDNIDDNKYKGHLYGLGASYVQNGAAYENHTGGNNNQNQASTPGLPNGSEAPPPGSS